MMNLKICKNKQIGKVIYFVEGEKTEVELLKNIFTNVFSYTFIEVKRNGETYLHFKNDKNLFNQVYVVVCKRPQIIGLEKDFEFFDYIYSILSYEYNLDPTEAAVYYIFDRDRDSNSSSVIKDLNSKLVNSRDNPGYDLNGMLLLSYPCVEAYLVTANEEGKLFRCGKEIKSYIYFNKYYSDRLNKYKVLFAGEYLLKSLKRIRKSDFSLSELDDMSKTNKDIFNFQERRFINERKYETLSMLSLSFIDLGLLALN